MCDSSCFSSGKGYWTSLDCSLTWGRWEACVLVGVRRRRKYREALRCRRPVGFVRRQRFIRCVRRALRVVELLVTQFARPQCGAAAANNANHTCRILVWSSFGLQPHVSLPTPTSRRYPLRCHYDLGLCSSDWRVSTKCQYTTRSPYLNLMTDSPTTARLRPTLHEVVDHRVLCRGI